MLGNLPEDHGHSNAVFGISRQVQHFYAQKQPFRVYHGSTNSTRKSPYRQNNIVNIQHLNRILRVDTQEKMVFVEPNVPMDKLVAETLKFGLVPPVVMEFPGITAGGGFACTSGESSSFKYGRFDRTVKVIEIVLGNGEVVQASAEERADLFNGAASSCGTLGIVTMLGIKLIAAKPYISLTYTRLSSIEHAMQQIKSEKQNPDLDFIDGIFFAKDNGILCLGRFTDQVPPRAILKQFTRPWDDWFYINAEKLSAGRSNWTEIIPIEDYFFRYDRGAFWMGKYTYKYFAIPCNRFTRWALNQYTHTRMMYHALHRSGLSNKFIIQDIAVPYDKSPRFLSYLDKHFQNYPIWICPLKVEDESDPSSHGFLTDRYRSSGMMLNFGVWGPGPSSDDEFVAWNKDFESEIDAIRGRKWLYAHTYYTPSQFWTIYDKEKHDQLRLKYHASHLPTLYDKVKNNCPKEGTTPDQTWMLWLYATFWAIWPLAGLYGWLQCVIAREYLMPQTGSGSITALRKAISIKTKQLLKDMK